MRFLLICVLATVVWLAIVIARSAAISGSELSELAATKANQATSAALLSALLPELRKNDPEHVLDDESVQVGFCVGVLAYTVNAFMLSNNEGAARLAINQYSAGQVALFSRYYDGNGVTKNYLQPFTRLSRSAKQHLDLKPGELVPLYDACVPTINRMSRRQQSTNITMFGKSLYENEKSMSQELLTRYGLAK
jgi:hypothetical protein